MGDAIVDAMKAVIEAELGRDKFRQLAKLAPPSREIDNVDRSMADDIIQLYRQFVPRLLSDEMRKRWMKDTASIGGRRPKPPRRNLKLVSWVRQHSHNVTAGEIQAQLDMMTFAKRKAAIGQAKSPGLSTLKNILADEKNKAHLSA